jgi:hypothetical protein
VVGWRWCFGSRDGGIPDIEDLSCPVLAGKAPDCLIR